MNLLAWAIELDIHEKYVEASKVYEDVLNEKNIPEEPYINLACLYWDVTDFGVNAHLSLPPDFISHAGNSMYSVLNEAEVRFGFVAEIAFWRLYFNFTTLGDAAYLKKTLELIEDPECSHVPYFHIYSQTKHEKYLPYVEKLIIQARAQPTAKNRYILSVLES
ncbi:MAG: hypothetical protein ACPG7F_07200 [Aggregatilineales bacterium]